MKIETNRTKKIVKNLFKNPLNSIITLFSLFLIIRIIIWFFDWGILNATWVGNTKQICFENSGACWIFIKDKIFFFVYGFIAKKDYWRINILFLLYLCLGLLFFVKAIKNKVVLILFYLILLPFITFVFAGGGIFGLSKISLTLWGGFMLTAVFSLMGLLYSFPIGLLLALGRRSKLPIIKAFSVGYIEFFRGIPLITILFMSSTVLPFFFPVGFEVPKILRVILGLVIFQSAYLAEVVRGGLQTVEKIQYESADSLGLAYAHKMYFVILPQALRNIVINIGDISIAFIKDTTLVYIIGLFDMLGIYVPLTSDPIWLGTETEALFFSGMLYWVLCFVVAKLFKGVDKIINKDRKGVSI